LPLAALRSMTHWRCVHVVSVMLIVGAVALLISKSTVIDRGRRHVTSAENCQRYSTSDEMSYILYGEGDNKSVYDRQLVDYVRSHISRPSPTRPRKLATPEKKDASQIGQSLFVDKLLSGRRNGFFVECGAADGEYFSNSLFFELERNWTGVLIEANPEYHRSLLDKNRGAYVLQACLSTKQRPATLRLLPAGVLSGIVDNLHPTHLSFIGANKGAEVTANCFPLNTIMEALGVSHVDYLSLDVEGPELEILRTVDWNRLRVDVITVEYRIYGGRQIGIDVTATLKKLRDIRELFGNISIYQEVALLPHGVDAAGLDIVFVRRT